MEPQLPIIVEGEFRPPTMARADVPIRIVGKGRLELVGETLHVSGLKERSMPLLTAALYLLVAATAIAILAGAIKMSDRERSDHASNTAAYLILAVCSAIGFAGSSYLRKLKREASERAAEPLEFVIPLASVKAVIWEDEVAVLRIKKFKPSGGIYFVPTDLALMHFLQEALIARGAKVKSVPGLASSFGAS